MQPVSSLNILKFCNFSQVQSLLLVWGLHFHRDSCHFQINLCPNQFIRFGLDQCHLSNCKSFLVWFMNMCLVSCQFLRFFYCRFMNLQSSFGQLVACHIWHLFPCLADLYESLVSNDEWWLNFLMLHRQILYLYLSWAMLLGNWVYAIKSTIIFWTWLSLRFWHFRLIT